MMSKIVEGNLVLGSPEMQWVSEKMLGCLKGTQIYSYYSDRIRSVLR